MPRRLLLLSTTTGYQLRAFGEAAHQLGFELVFATDRCHALDDPWRDAAVAVRFHEEDASLEAVLSAVRERLIDGVLAVGDRPVVLAARVAEALRLPGNPPDAARASASKRLAHDRLASGGLHVASYLPATVDADIGEVSAGLTYPVVIKPTVLSGSRGVIRANTPRELVAAFQRVSALLSRPDVRVLRTGLERDLLIEQYVEGREYAIEGLMTAGAFTPLAVFDKPDPLEGPFFEETIYVTPSAAPDAVQQKILEATDAACRALGLRHGPVHAECRVNDRGVFVLEVAARPIGGLCSRVLRFGRRHSPDPAGPDIFSLEYLLLLHATGQDVSGLRRESSAAGVMMIPIPRRGIFKSVQGEEQALTVAHVEEIRITAKRDQLLEPLPEASGYLGFIFARAPHAGDVEQALREAHARLSFSVDAAIQVKVAKETE